MGRMKQFDFSSALTAVRQQIGNARPLWALVLGSGWSVVLERFGSAHIMAYADIPGLGQAGVQGHAGELHIVEINGRVGLIFAGRRHLYEGIGFGPIATPVYIAKSLGAETLLLTNAAGGIRPGLAPGDLMLLDDHINMMGQSPLGGEHDAFWGPRFPDQSTVYDPALRQTLASVAESVGHHLDHGVYLATSGPTYETPAEIRAYATMGADAVGMSTVPEAILGNAAGMRVGGISCITNFAAGVADQALDHDEVLQVTEKAKPRMGDVLAAICRHLSEPPPA
ncbi:MAG: purine-nucleoside phosphorylase [Candidatus Promineifilaceae bacterium]|jgi:purine-nucleoside phosphorylase